MNFLDHQKSITSFFPIGCPVSLKETKELAEEQTNTEAEIILIPGN